MRKSGDPRGKAISLAGRSGVRLHVTPILLRRSNVPHNLERKNKRRVFTMKTALSPNEYIQIAERSPERALLARFTRSSAAGGDGVPRETWACSAADANLAGRYKSHDARRALSHPRDDPRP